MTRAGNNSINNAFKVCIFRRKLHVLWIFFAWVGYSDSHILNVFNLREISMISSYFSLVYTKKIRLYHKVCGT